MQSIQDIYTLFKQSTGISTDTRKIEAGHLFFALKGGNFNGNKFALQALEKGASYVIIDEKEYKLSDQCILVEDCLKALQDLARHHRDQFNIPVIGITGSNGKTTTKELVYQVLATTFNTHYTKGNFNNHIGVPLTLLDMPLDTEMAIIEMGANHIGEIELLCQIANPTHGLITNIGKAHLEGFGSLEGVARGKSELYKHLMDNDGVTFVNGESEILMRMATRLKNPLIYSYTQKEVYCYGTLDEVNPYLTISYEEEKERKTHLVGQYNFENILSALALAKFFKVNTKKAVDAVCAYAPNNNRSQVSKTEKNDLILDAYNANPSSMQAAILNFKTIDQSPKAIILGDMFELGNDSDLEHKRIYDLALEQGFDHYFFVGNYFKKALSTPDFIYSTKEDLIQKLKELKLQNHLILVKGSRGIGLESIVPYL